MQVYLVIIGLTVISWHKAFILQRIALHKTSGNRLLYLIIEFSQTTDTLRITVFVTPNRQRSSPETRTGEIPIIQILQPVAKATCSSRFWMPIDGII